MKESVKIDATLVDKVRKRIKKTKQTIGGFFEIAAKAELVLTPPDQKLKEWKEKAEKWDVLGGKIASFYINKEGEYDEDQPENDGDLNDIGEVAATAFGWL